MGFDLSNTFDRIHERLKVDDGHLPPLPTEAEFYESARVSELENELDALRAERNQLRAALAATRERGQVLEARIEQLEEEADTRITPTGKQALRALLDHFRRHTDHRCEIDRDAEWLLANWDAAEAQGGAE